MTGSRSHAADDGSLARSTGGAAARGAMLIALAVVIGLVLMAFALDDKSTEVTAGNDDDTSTSTTVDPNDDDPAPTDTDTGETNGDGEDPGTTSPATTIDPNDPEVGTPRPPAEVNVLVANGTGGQGVAGSTADKLTALNYIAKASNAPSTADSVIYYREGYDADARAVADIIGGTADLLLPAPDAIAVSPSAIEDGRLGEANIVVIVGNDGRIPLPGEG